MEEQPKDDVKQQAIDQGSSIDPLRRVFIPIEKRTANGTLVFRTHDHEMYARLGDGSIRRVTPKVNGKQARKQRHRDRRLAKQ